MATLKQLREIFAPILATYPDLVLRRRWLFRPPIGTAIIGVFLGRTAYASRIDMALSVLPLSRFSPLWSPGFERGFEVEREVGTPPTKRQLPDGGRELAHTWEDIFEPDYKAHLIRNFDAKARPFLDKAWSFEDIEAWAHTFRGVHFSPEPAELIDSWIATMRGNFAAAANQLQAFFERMGPPPPWMVGDERRQQEAIRDALRTDDRTVIAAFLHAMEERTIAAFGLQRFWNRTPFPFERT